MTGRPYIVIEYAPDSMEGRHDAPPVPVKIDGHYRSREDAEGVAAYWAEASNRKGTRIVVAQIVHEAKSLDHWKKP